MTLVLGILKIAAPTLMMKSEIIMTTDVKVTSAPDLLVSNEVFNIRSARKREGGVLSVASFLTAGASSDSVSSVLSYLYDLIEKKFPDCNLWLFLGSSAWQPDTRIVRHRKLWGALRFRGYEIVGGSNSQEYIVEAEGKIKFFGALRLSKLSIETVASVLEAERCSYVAALPKGFDVQIALDKGWSGDVEEDLSFHYLLSEKQGLLFKKVGEFDDGERGFISVGLLEQISVLLH
ncbi:hypothetical protein J3P85_03565 [Pseudomonas sp. Z1-12]|uniref:hypothetical protein n=1 Tax=Pseudomonas sp. Z1-12 TaxID=2817408 RepID=UPI003DA9E546